MTLLQMCTTAGSVYAQILMTFAFRAGLQPHDSGLTPHPVSRQR